VGLVKLLLKIALSLLGLLVAGVVVAFFSLGAIVGKGIEAGCTEALGVETSVGLVRVGLVTGHFSARRVRIDNPAGFETDHFFTFDRVHFEVRPDSLREDTIVVPLLEIDGIDVSLETVDKKTNYDVILDNLHRFSNTGSADPRAEVSEAKADEGGKSLVIREAVIRNITARIDLGKVSGAADRIEVEIPELRLRPNRETGSAEASVAQVTQVIVTAVLIGIAKKAPAALAKNLLSGAGSLGNVMIEMPGAMSTGAANIGDSTAKLGKGAVDAVKSIGGLFGGGDDEK
jgi:hypothetical protein